MGSEMEQVDRCPSEIACQTNQSGAKKSVQTRTAREVKADGAARSAAMPFSRRVAVVCLPAGDPCGVANGNQRVQKIDQRLVSKIAALSGLCDNHGIRMA